MFQFGRWLNTYEIPFYGNQYLKSNTNGNWNTQGLAAKFGDTASKILKNTLSVDFPTQPAFNIGDVSSNTFGEINNEFYLININDTYLDKNFRFLQAFFAGTQWLQLTFGVIQSSNVYNVICPGRFQLMWCSIDVTIETVGKLRTNDYMYKKYNAPADEAPAERQNKNKIGSIEKDTLWPDAWKVSMQIKPLTPNNYNMQMDYYINGMNADAMVYQDGAESDMMSKLFNGQAAHDFFKELSGSEWTSALFNKELEFVEQVQKIRRSIR